MANKADITPLCGGPIVQSRHRIDLPSEIRRGIRDRRDRHGHPPGGGRRPGSRGTLVRPADALGAADPGRGRPGQVRPGRSGSTTFGAPTRTPSASAPAAAWPTTPPKFRSTTAARGWATATRSAICRGLPQARHGRHCADRPACRAYDDVHDAHPDWIAVDAEGRKRRHWASPELWVTCALGPYNFEFMTAVTRGDHVRATRSTASSSTAGPVPACATASTASRTSGPRPGIELPRTNDPQDPARRATSSGSSSGSSSCGGLWDDEIRKINPDSCVIPNAGGGATSPLDMKTIGELARRPLRRPPGATAADAVPGPTARTRRNTAPRWVASRSAASSAWAWRSRIAGRTRCRARPRSALWVADGIANGLRPWFTKFSGMLHDARWLAVVEEIYALAPPRRAVPAERAPLARVAWSTRNRRPGSTAASGAGESRGPRARVVPGAGRGAHPVRDGPRPAARPGAAGPVQDCSSCRTSRASRRPMRADSARSSSGRRASSRLTRRRSMTSGASAAGLRPGGPVRGLVRRPDRRADANSYLRLEDDPGSRRASAARRSRRCAADHQRRIGGSRSRRPCQFADAPLTLIPSLSGPADGDGLSADASDRHRRRCTCARSAAGGSSIFRGTSTGSSGRCCRVDHGSLLANAVEWATNEDAP